MSTLSLENFPTELLYRILGNLDARTICVGFRYVCKRFYTITDAYDRYHLDLKLVSKTEFELICRIIRPENVRSLTLCENINTIHQMILFNQLVDICRFTQLRSATIDYFHDSLLDNIFKHFATCSLTSFSINIEESHVTRFGIPRLLSSQYVTLPASLLSIIAQSTLRKLHLHTHYRINERSWPSQCVLQYLNINRCTLDEYCIILQRSPLLKTVILTNCDSLVNYDTNLSLSTFALLSFEQVTSLTLEDIDHLNNDKLKFFLSLTPSLVHLQVTSKTNIFNEFQWEEFIKAKLSSLKEFQFYFTCHQYLLPPSVDPVSIIISFKTKFWLDKGWFFTSDYLKNLRLIRVYSIPVCVPDFYYVPELDKDSYSTYNIMNNDIATMDNVKLLILDLATYMTFITPIKDRPTDRHLFRNVTQFEIRITDKTPIDSLCYLSSLIDFSHLVVVKLYIISDPRTSHIDFHRHPFERNHQTNDNKCNITIEKVCSIIPPHVKQLEMTVTSVDEMIIILTRLDHLYTVVFRFARYIPDCPHNIIAWLENKKTDFLYHYEYNFLSIWLGKTRIDRQPLPKSPVHKRAKILHRYNHF